MDETQIAMPPARELSFPDPHHVRSRDIFRLYARIWPFIRPYRRHVALLMLAIIPALPAGLVALAIARILFDVVGNGHPLTAGQAWLIHVPLTASRETVLLHLIVIVVVGAAVIGPVVALAFGYAVWILQRITNLFRVDLYARLQELSLRFHAEEKIGDAIFRMFQDSAAIPGVIDTLVLRPLLGIPFILADLVWLLMLNRPMAIVLALFIPAQFFVAIWWGDSLRRGFAQERETTAQAMTRIEETLASIKTVKAFGTELSEGDIYASDNWNAFMAARRARMRFVRYRVVNNTMLGAAHVAAICLGARQVLMGGGVFGAALSLGSFQGTLGILRRSSGRIMDLGNRWGGLQDTTIAMARVLELLGSVNESRVPTGMRLAPHSIEVLRFEHVNFAYDDNEHVLRDLTLETHAGTITALTGPSGSGKSTVVSLLLRFFDPDNGRITADGIDIREFQLAAWRGVLSVAFQENPLFAATIRDNIAYSNPAASENQIRTAVRRAGLERLIQSLPDGLDTMLGERGSKLSTGQAQRIGLARALLRDAQILLLDEPTAALDGASEATVLSGIREWIDEAPSRRMAIVATHRPTTEASADQVFTIPQRQSIEAPSDVNASATEVSDA